MLEEINFAVAFMQHWLPVKDNDRRFIAEFGTKVNAIQKCYA